LDWQQVSGVVDQSGARAEGNISGRDINKTIHNYAAPRAAGIIEVLLQRLNDEMAQDKKIRETLHRLQRFYKQRAPDGVIGLEAKLHASGRQTYYMDAIEMKEMFVKLLEQWSLYASAQQIFIHLLARAERHFNDLILPQIASLNVVEINKLMNELIVEPTVAECGASVIELDHNTAMGMIYWLAEQCFVRWHK
jgi:hypothetical protein